MATYTMYLHDVIMHVMDRGQDTWLPGAVTFRNTNDELLTEDGINARIMREIDYKSIGLTEYPIFEADYRAGLNRKIVDHYWNREIGAETIDLFIQQLRRKMNEIMPYYNQLYKSERLNMEPLLNFRTTATGTTDTDASARAASSEFPQNQLAEDEDYATSATDSVSKTVANVLNNSEGFTQSQSSLLNEYRSTFLNIDLMVIHELEPLFMQLWSNNDEFTPNRNPLFAMGMYSGLLTPFGWY